MACLAMTCRLLASGLLLLTVLACVPRLAPSSPSSAPASTPPDQPVPSPLVTRVLVSFWTDTDDKDADEFVSVEVWQGERLLGYAGPWGKDEIWGTHEGYHKGQPHRFEVPIISTPESQSAELTVKVTKSEALGNGGKPWHPQMKFGYRLADGTERWTIETGTVKLGGGHASTFKAQLARRVR